jgi:hypothetical protein
MPSSSNSSHCAVKMGHTINDTDDCVEMFLWLLYAVVGRVVIVEVCVAIMSLF